MPAVSEAQRRLLFARFGAAWVKRHHFDNKGKLPGHVHEDVLSVARRRHLHGKGKR